MKHLGLLKSDVTSSPLPRGHINSSETHVTFFYGQIKSSPQKLSNNRNKSTNNQDKAWYTFENYYLLLQLSLNV